MSTPKELARAVLFFAMQPEPSLSRRRGDSGLTMRRRIVIPILNAMLPGANFFLSETGEGGGSQALSEGRLERVIDK